MSRLVGFVCDSCAKTFKERPDYTLDIWVPSTPEDKRKKPDPEVKDRLRYDLCPECHEKIFGMLKETDNVLRGVNIGTMRVRGGDIEVTDPRDELSPEQISQLKQRQSGVRVQRKAEPVRKKDSLDDWEIKDGKKIKTAPGIGRVSVT